MKSNLKLSILSILAMSAFLLSGCASIINGTKEKVTVKTPPVKGAHCQLKNDEGSWTIKKTPGVVKVHRGHDNLNIDCKKKGYLESKKVVVSKLSAMTAGNVLAGGFIGAGVDLANGSAYKYPKTVTVPMKKDARA